MIIVTRPGKEGKELVNDLHVAGCTAIHLPLFDIEPMLDQKDLQCQLNILKSKDIVIAVSPQIVPALAAVKDITHFPKNIHYLAIGEKTARLLHAHLDLTATYQPHHENSEALLTLPLLNNVHEKRVLILRGTKGREQLKETLQKRGAIVKYVTCYTRRPLQYSSELTQNWSDHTIITITSMDCVILLNRLVASNRRSNFTLITCSERLFHYAKAQGWSQVISSKSANNQNLFKTIRTLCHNKEAKD